MAVFQVNLGELVPPRFLPPLVSKENLWKQIVAQVDKGHRFYTGQMSFVSPNQCMEGNSKHWPPSSGMALYILLSSLDSWWMVPYSQTNQAHWLRVMAHDVAVTSTKFIPKQAFKWHLECGVSSGKWSAAGSLFRVLGLYQHLSSECKEHETFTKKQ